MDGEIDRKIENRLQARHRKFMPSLCQGQRLLVCSLSYRRIVEIGPIYSWGPQTRVSIYQITTKKQRTIQRRTKRLQIGTKQDEKGDI